MKRLHILLLLLSFGVITGCDGTLRLCNSSNESIEFRVQDLLLDEEEMSIDLGPGQEAVLPYEFLPEEDGRLFTVSAYDMNGEYLGACSILASAIAERFSDNLKADWDGETLNCTDTDVDEFGEGGV